MIAGRPHISVRPPAAVVALARGESIEAIWRNELGGLTFALGHTRFLKWIPAGVDIDLAREAARLAWAAPFTAVPHVLKQGADEDGSWLMTKALAGESAVASRWCAEPERAVTAIGAGLRALHDSLPVTSCPFSWSIQERLADAQARAAAGGLDPARWHPEHRPIGIRHALEQLADPPPIDRLVVCHGDACAPNTLIGKDGRCTGHVDLGTLGLADRWADLAIATWSTEWNYGPGWDETLLAAYGVPADDTRTAYYRLLWDLGP